MSPSTPSPLAAPGGGGRDRGVPAAGEGERSETWSEVDRLVVEVDKLGADLPDLPPGERRAALLRRLRDHPGDTR